ncbi:hypothetical protein KC19_VG317400 [Ceratodon purpureus]|uniref:Dynein axonemal heavy chain 2/5/8 coiled-coil domain-containing protein n=1 Tax=Ceratodon purpureus TaxID=3225 RepID=A0A8T0HVJ9_CERPU|nr:hypothetical protein KC19_VG317400 [Ceratodon purpureus]
MPKKRNEEDCNKPPQNLGELTQTAQLWRTICDECTQTETRFGPLHEKYRILNKFEVPLHEEEVFLLERLPNAWEEFKIMLAEVELKLENAKNNFRDTLEEMVGDFVVEV